MNDKELLEMAAKAAEFDLTDYEWIAHSETTPFCKKIGVSFFWGFRKKGLGKTQCWNPLIDDGDAFRLLIKLGIRQYSNDSSEYETCAAEYDDGKKFVWIEENINGDTYATTRRAIVRVAAELAK